jgi:hypothetical protein
VFYVDVLRSATYSLSCRKKKKRAKYIVPLFLHVKPQYEKKICFFLLLKGNDAIAWLLFALEGKKKNSDAEE